MTYEAWRITYQDSEQAALAAWTELTRAEQRIAELEEQVAQFQRFASGISAMLASLSTGHDTAEGAHDLEQGEGK